MGGLLGDKLFNEKKYEDAAHVYSNTERNFEEIALKFIMATSSDGLECLIFLILFLFFL